MIAFNDTDLSTFLAQFWQKKPLVLRNALPHFTSPVSPEELAGLSLEPEVESRLVIQHSDNDYSLKTGPFDEATYQNLPEKNWTLLVQGMDRLVPEVTDLLQEFEFLPRWRIDDIMVSYAVKGGNVGPHFDHYDVFLLQAAGQRQWMLTSQDCSEDNYIQGVDLRLMQTFNIEEDYVFSAGDILYIPPKWGHHGVALDDACMTYSIGYRTYRGLELWDSLGDHLAETECFTTLYQDPTWQTDLNPAEITDNAVNQAQQLLYQALQDPKLLKTWFGRFATQLDPTAAQQLPEPLSAEDLATLAEFEQALMESAGLRKDPVCRFAYTHVETPKSKTLLYINGTIWASQQASPAFIAQLANQAELQPAQLKQACENQANIELLYDLWQQQWVTFI